MGDHLKENMNTGENTGEKKKTPPPPPKIVAMVRVKDGMLFINDWLANISSLVDEIVVVDNGSTDGTYEILSSHPSVTRIERTTEYFEGRDKEILFRLARERSADWILWLDVDETFEDRFTKDHLRKLIETGRANRIFFRRYHFVSMDRFVISPFWLLFTAMHDRVLWKEHPNGKFEYSKKLDSGLVTGIPGRARPSHFRIKHTGYMDKDLVEQKVAVYNKFPEAPKQTVLRMRLDSCPSFKWHEYNDAPIRVTAFNLFLDVIYVVRYLKRFVLRFLTRRFK